MRLISDGLDASRARIVLDSGRELCVPYKLSLGRKPLSPASLAVDGGAVRVEFREADGLAASIEDSVEERSGLIVMKRRWTLFHRGPWTLNASFTNAAGTTSESWTGSANNPQPSISIYNAGYADQCDTNPNARCYWVGIQTRDFSGSVTCTVDGNSNYNINKSWLIY